VAVQNYGNDTCVLAGEGYPIFTPINPNDVLGGGINISHEAAPELEETGKACPNKPDGTVVARSTKYMMLCDPDVATLEVDAAFEEDECQYVIKMRSSYACGQPNVNPGGNCLAPAIPAGVSQDCRANVVPLDEAMVGPDAYNDAVNEDCRRKCRLTVPEDCNADCNVGLDRFVGDCTANGGVTYSLRVEVTYEPLTPGGANPITDIRRYTCIAAECANEDDEAAFDHFLTDRYCGVAGIEASTISCGVTFQGLVAASPSPSPSPSMAPSATSAPSVAPSAAPSIVPLPSATPTTVPAAAPSGDDGGAVAGAIFGTGFGLAFLLFGGYHVSTRMGWVARDKVPAGPRGCLECACCAPLFARCSAGSAVSERAGFATSGGGTFSPSPVGGAPPASSSGGGFGAPASSGGGYQNI